MGGSVGPGRRTARRERTSELGPVRLSGKGPTDVAHRGGRVAGPSNPSRAGDRDAPRCERRGSGGGLLGVRGRWSSTFRAGGRRRERRRASATGGGEGAGAV